MSIKSLKGKADAALKKIHDLENSGKILKERADAAKPHIQNAIKELHAAAEIMEGYGIVSPTPKGESKSE